MYLSCAFLSRRKRGRISYRAIGAFIVNIFVRSIGASFLILSISLLFIGCDLFQTETFTFTVNYDANENTSGSVPTDNNKYVTGEPVTVFGNTGDLEKEGYSFGGWNTEADYSGEHYLPEEQFSMPFSNVTLYAVWDIPSSVTYESNHATSGTVPIDGNEYLLREEVTALGNTGNLERTGYSFSGWNTASDGGGNRYTAGQTFDMPFSDVTLYAEWEINTYTVNFNTDGGSDVLSQEIDHGAMVDKPDTPTKQDYFFGGWFKEPELENPWNFDTETITEDITLYAKWDSIYPDSFAGGSGTEADPYQVETAGHLYIVRNHLDKHFIQTADIDLSAFSEGEGWEPIGVWYGEGYTENAIFVGSYDGDGYSIYNLRIDKIETSGIGLFGYTGEMATLKNISLIDVDIIGKAQVGGLIGVHASSESVSNIFVSGSVKSDVSYYYSYYAGGVIGDNQNNASLINVGSETEVTGRSGIGGLVGKNTGTIVDSYASGDIHSSSFNDGYVGGLVGYNSGDVIRSYATGRVNKGRGNYSSGYTGGLIGYQSGGKIIDCYASGNVTSGSEVPYTGGLVGDSNNCEIIRSYATGNVYSSSYATGGLVGGGGGKIEYSFAIGQVRGTSSVGGLIGESSGIVQNSYSHGKVTGTNSQVGGLIGKSTGLVSNTYSIGEVIGPIGIGGLIGAFTGEEVSKSYYDTNTSGRSDTIQGTPKTTAEMMQQATFVNWDFNTIWAIDEGISYPHLR